MERGRVGGLTLLVAAVDPPTLARMLEQIAAGRATSLAADPDFLAARASSPGPRTGSVYVRELVNLGADAATATGREILPVGPGRPGARLAVGDHILGRSRARLTDRGAAAAEPGRVAERAIAAEWASLWPQGTLLIYAASFDPRLDYLSDFHSDEQLQELDELLAEASESLGIDLREDVLSLLSGEFAIGLQAVDPGWLSEISVENPVDAAVLASYRPERLEDVRATMSRVRELIADLGAEWATADVGAADPAWFVPLQDEAGWAPGYVLHDGWLAVGSTERTLRKFVAVREGAASSLAHDPEYVRATDPLPSQLSFLFYADLEWSRMLLGQAQDEASGTCCPMCSAGSRSGARSMTATFGSPRSWRCSLIRDSCGPASLESHPTCRGRSAAASHAGYAMVATGRTTTPTGPTERAGQLWSAVECPAPR